MMWITNPRDPSDEIENMAFTMFANEITTAEEAAEVALQQMEDGEDVDYLDEPEMYYVRQALKYRNMVD